MAKRGVSQGRWHDSGNGSAAIPDKLYFRIGEVAALCHVPTYVLRFWQTEFTQLRPGKSGTGQRLYRKRDVEMALRIKTLLHDQGYTIAGAKGVLAEEASPPRLQPELPLPQAGEDRVHAKLRYVRSELRELLGLLERKTAAPAAKPAPTDQPSSAARLFPARGDAPDRT